MLSVTSLSSILAFSSALKLSTSISSSLVCVTASFTITFFWAYFWALKLSFSSFLLNFFLAGTTWLTQGLPRQQLRFTQAFPLKVSKTSLEFAPHYVNLGIVWVPRPLFLDLGLCRPLDIVINVVCSIFYKCIVWYLDIQGVQKCTGCPKFWSVCVWSLKLLNLLLLNDSRPLGMVQNVVSSILYIIRTYRVSKNIQGVKIFYIFHIMCLEVTNS